MKKHLVFLTLLLGALALMPALAQQQDASGPNSLQRDTPKFHRTAARAIPNHYIVVLDEDVAPPDKLGVEPDTFAVARQADEVMRMVGAVPTFVYTAALRGFSAQMTEEEALKISADDRVRFVEEDSVVEANVTQSNPPWGLDRIDQAARPLSLTYTYTTTGAGVNAYIIDTGIRRTHAQFGGRASAGFDAIGDGQNGNDCNGHGTHVAGTVGGSTYGVAKAVRLFTVRVLSCSGSGSTSGVIAGVDWVTRNHVKPAVANMSLGGGASTAMDNAVRNSIAAGVTYAIAAGNSNTNASNSSPARVSEAITVGASTSTDARASFSNFGSVVDIFAPGQAILSAWRTSNTAAATLSGTSMAAPHVAGVAARFLQSSPASSPAAVRNALVNQATLNRLTGLPTGTANRLLFRSGAQ
jgi:subtilisin family serine protease